MLKFKNQNITTVQFLITTIKTKTSNTFSLLYIYPRQHDLVLIHRKINHRKDISNRLICNGKKPFRNNNKAGKNGKKTVISGNFGKGFLASSALPNVE